MRTAHGLWCASFRASVAFIRTGQRNLLHSAQGPIGRSPRVSGNYAQFGREADFRATLIHVRENAEPVALLRREGRLKQRLLNRIDELVRNLGFFTTDYNYLILIIPTLFVAPQFIRGQVEFGVITQSAMAFTQLLGGFSLIVNQFGSLSSFAAVIARLGRSTGNRDRREV
jgi:vitamin B12/bleomycin/antimicrobial peptide transport system ATP-binding/permease protein